MCRRCWTRSIHSENYRLLPHCRPAPRVKVTRRRLQKESSVCFEVTSSFSLGLNSERRACVLSLTSALGSPTPVALKMPQFLKGNRWEWKSISHVKEKAQLLA